MVLTGKVRHHGLAHFLLTGLLFLLAISVFGGWTEGPFSSAFFLGIKAYVLVRSAARGDLDAASSFAPTLLEGVVVFLINLVLFYSLAAIFIFLFNLFVGRKE